MIICEKLFSFLTNKDGYTNEIIKSAYVIFEYIENNKKRISIRKIRLMDDNPNSMFFRFRECVLFLDKKSPSITLDGIAINILYVSYNKEYTAKEAFESTLEGTSLSDFIFTTDIFSEVYPAFKICYPSNRATFGYVFKRKHNGKNDSGFIVDSNFNCQINKDYNVKFSIENSFSFRDCIEIEEADYNTYGIFLGYIGRHRILVCYYNEKSKSFELKEVFTNVNRNRTIDFYKLMYSIMEYGIPIGCYINDFNEDHSLMDVPSGKVVLMKRYAINSPKVISSWYSIVRMVVKDKTTNKYNCLSFFNISISDKSSNRRTGETSYNCVTISDSMDACNPDDIVRFLNLISTNELDYKDLVDRGVINNKLASDNFINQVSKFAECDSECTISNSDSNDNQKSEEYKIFDFVIAKNKKDGRVAVYQYQNQNDLYYNMIGGVSCSKEYFEIMPYKGNEHLVK